MITNEAPKAPPPPDPNVVAQAQFGTNLGTAAAQSAMGNVNQYGPTGQTEFSQSGMQTITGPNGQQYQVPTYSQTTTLSPEQQRLYQTGVSNQQQFADVANQQGARIGETLGQPASASGLPGVPTDLSADRQRVEQAMFDRMSPWQERDREALETKLSNQGFQRGTQAFTDAMQQFNMGVNDARLGIIGQGLQEQQGLFGMNMANRNRAMQEQFAYRNAPINEMSALMSGSQVSMPNVQGYNAPQVGQTGIGDFIYNSAALKQKAYEQEMGAYNNNVSGMYGLAGSALGAGARMYTGRA